MKMADFEKWRSNAASILKKIGTKKSSETSQAGYEVDNPHLRAVLSFLSPILGNLGPHLAPKVRGINVAGGMRGGPGDSRFELKLSSHSSNTVAPESVAGLTTPAAHHRPPPRCHASKLKTSSSSLLEVVLALLGTFWGAFCGLCGISGSLSVSLAALWPWGPGG